MRLVFLLYRRPRRMRRQRKATGSGGAMTSAAPSATSAAPNESAIRRLLRATEVDTRMLGMIGALALIWIGFNIITWAQNGEGLFLTPRNLWNLSVQTSSIAVMATGMVLVIVMC